MTFPGFEACTPTELRELAWKLVQDRPRRRREQPCAIDAHVLDEAIRWLMIGSYAP